MHSWRMARSARRGAIPLFAALLAGQASAAPACDPGLASAAADALGYRVREDRCEGRYLREVSGSALVVAGFGEPLPSWGPDASGTVDLNWGPTPQSGDVKLLAQSLKRRVYYRMDAIQPPLPARFVWPRQLAATLVPGAGDLGILASQVRPGASQHLLIPVRLGPTASDHYELVLLPGTEWQELRYSVSTAREDGAVAEVIVKDKPLQLGYYPAGRAVRVPVAKSALPRAGTYRIDLEAQLDAGGSVVRSLWFTHTPGW